MSARPRALLIEDNADDALLVERTLAKGGVPVVAERVDSELGLRSALATESWDLILCDFELPGFSGFEALNIVRQHDSDVPFIFVSGTIGEEAAVRAMRAGAHDYVLKHQLQRLAPAAEREMREAQVRREARLAQAALQRSELRFQRVFESNVVGIGFFDVHGRILDANDAFLRMVGFTRDDLARGAVDWKRVTPPAYAEADEVALSSLRKTGSCRPYKKEFVHPSGERVPVLISASRLDDAEQTGVAIFVDISSERRAERERAEATALVAAMVDSTPLPVILLDATNRVSLWNPAATKLFGWTSEEVLNQPLPFSAKTREGLPIVRFPSLVPGDTRDAEEITTASRSGEMLTLEVYLSPTRDADGRVHGTALLARDLTESRKLEARLRQSQKMEIVGAMASGIAHDFNNVLSVIALSIELALNDKVDDAHATIDLQTARDAAYRGAALTRQLLSFSKPNPPSRMPVNLGGVVHDISRMLERLLGIPNITLAIDAPTEGLWIDADRGQLEQILLNLAINARDAMPKGGTLSLTLNRTSALGHATAELEVRDTGLGIPPELRELVFEPFFTTKDPGRGTGLGLSTVRELVHQHQGTIHIESVLDEGTTFVLRFPLLEGTRSEAAAACPTKDHGTATILVVDDEPLVRRIADRLLARLGYRVLAAASGNEALTAFEAAEPRPRLLVSDLDMPGMRGEELAERLRALHPSMPVLFVSGSTICPDLADLQRQGPVAFLPKPFREQDIADAVSRLLRTSQPDRPLGDARGQ